MDFLGMGPMELGLILVVAMIFLGPTKIVDLGRQLGKAVHYFRKATSEITTSVSREMEQMKIEAEKTKSSLTSVSDDVSAMLKTDPPRTVPPTVKSGAGRPGETIDSPGAGI